MNFGIFRVSQLEFQKNCSKIREFRKHVNSEIAEICLFFIRTESLLLHIASAKFLLLLTITHRRKIKRNSNCSSNLCILCRVTLSSLGILLWKSVSEHKVCFLGVSLGILDSAGCVQVGSNLCGLEAARCKNPPERGCISWCSCRRRWTHREFVYRVFCCINAVFINSGTVFFVSLRVLVCVDVTKS